MDSWTGFFPVFKVWKYTQHIASQGSSTKPQCLELLSGCHWLIVQEANLSQPSLLRSADTMWLQVCTLIPSAFLMGPSVTQGPKANRHSHQAWHPTGLVGDFLPESKAKPDFFLGAQLNSLLHRNSVDRVPRKDHWELPMLCPSDSFHLLVWLQAQIHTEKN